MSDWRSVTEPPSLEGVLRTAGGMPVPWAAAWTSEDNGYVARLDPRLVQRGCQHPAMFEATGRPGEGHAKLAVISPARQREAALELRCQVCRAQVGDGPQPWDPPLWLADLRSSQTTAVDVVRDQSGRQAITIDGRVCPLIYEPWLCEPCLLYSLRACKGLRSLRRRQMLTLWRVRSAQFVPTLERPVEPPARGETPPAVVTYVKLALIDGEEIEPYEILRAARESA
jgi:hypothetical protein